MRSNHVRDFMELQNNPRRHWNIGVTDVCNDRTVVFLNEANHGFWIYQHRQVYKSIFSQIYLESATVFPFLSYLNTFICLKTLIHQVNPVVLMNTGCGQ